MSSSEEEQPKYIPDKGGGGGGGEAAAAKEAAGETAKGQQQGEQDEEAPAPPSLERARARQISRVGAVAVAGIDATPAPAANIDLPTAGDEENVLMMNHQLQQQQQQQSTTFPTEAPTSTSTLGSDATTTTTDMPPPSQMILQPNVTATLVTDEEYEAELHRVILRTSVKASRVETLEASSDDERRKQWNHCVTTIVIFCTALLCIVILGTVVYLVLPDDTFRVGEDGSSSSSLTNNDNNDATVGVGFPTGAPTLAEEYLSDNEKYLVNFLKERSFDGGEALRKYASPQRVALRYISAEFSNIRLDEKLIDVYAVATFFFSTGGISWTNNTKWKSGDPVCVWHGIGCDVNGHVIAMELPQNNLLGTLPPELGLLAPRPIEPSSSNATTAGLTRLDLSGNGIQGKIPEQVGLLSSMEEFLIQDNLFSGRIPRGIRNWTFLQRLSLFDTYLEGEIPTELCSLANVTTWMSVDCLKVECQCCDPSCGENEVDYTIGQQRPEEVPTLSTEPASSTTTTTAAGTVSQSDAEGEDAETALPPGEETGTPSADGGDETTDIDSDEADGGRGG
uniref:Leucine-rich repeat-containing N-terminal plant-type domain-containing protein n=1 Tax=Amphora coffeiformis TaxID=265554 RepID=A0A7S3KWS7_9STRA|mmetsp:Transcript_8126/g.15720  ORF Transcript_8126/g.15720 Transcript_8126/m.15720 type:complete len:565 (+) Transcript_8126:99-1793(+)|eukprot:scaffold8005_cov275-Amphora_coffeaeformis.AAC.18